MEVIYPSSKCEVNGSHYFIEAVSLSGIFQCKHCKVVKWQPVYWSDAVKMSDLVKRQGIDRAYNISMQHRKKTRHIIEALSQMSGLVISEEVMQELRKENVESGVVSPWTNAEMGEGVVSAGQKAKGKKQLRKKYLKH